MGFPKLKKFLYKGHYGKEVSWLKKDHICNIFLDLKTWAEISTLLVAFAVHTFYMFTNR